MPLDVSNPRPPPRNPLPWSAPRPSPHQTDHDKHEAGPSQRPPQRPPNNALASPRNLSSRPTQSQIPRQPAHAPLTPAQQTILRRHGLSNPTMNTLLTLPHGAPPDEILAAACRATELTSFPLRPAERALFSHLNATANHGAGSSSGPAQRIPWPLAVKSPSQPWEKAFLFAQAHAGGDESWIYAPPRIHKPGRDALLADRRPTIRVLDKALRAIADLAGLKADAATVRRAMELDRSIVAGVWETGGTEGFQGDDGRERKFVGDGRELLQVREIGGKKMEALVKAGIRSVRGLADAEFWRIERILKRNPPFGMQLLETLAPFPRVGMRARVERWATAGDLEAVVRLNARDAGDRIGAAASGADVAGGGRKTAIVRVQVWMDNVDVPVWREKNPWVCFCAERGPMPEALERRVYAYRRGQGQGRKGGNRAGGEGELLFFWRGSSKRLVRGGSGGDGGDGGKTFCFPAELVPGMEMFMWVSCEEVIGTLTEGVVVAPPW